MQLAIRRRWIVPWFLCATALARAGSPEPDLALAKLWWPEMPVYTPVGWKDHFFRFNVLFNGAIVSMPYGTMWHEKIHSRPWAYQDVQVTVLPALDDKIPQPLGWSYEPVQHQENHPLTDFTGNRFGDQGWCDRPTPLLWTRWRQSFPKLDGLVLKKEFFAHLDGGGDVKTGIEPLFGWIRLSVDEVHPHLLAGEAFTSAVNPDGTQSAQNARGRTCGFLVKINKFHMQHSSYRQENLLVRPAISDYWRALRHEPLSDGGFALVEPDGKIRLAMPGGQKAKAKFIDRPEGGKDYYVFVELPLRKGAKAGLLLPVIPTERSAVERELALGYDAALRESDASWSRKPATAARIETPEPEINCAIEANVKMAEIVAETNPENGEQSHLLGSLVFPNLWPVPATMILHMALDPMGRHDIVEKYLRIYKTHQGTRKPPGPTYEMHPGYLGAPRSLSTIEWAADHGAILHTIAQHALRSGDERFTREYLDAILKACEFIRDARAATNHPGFRGILPPAVASDMHVPEQAVWVDGWNYKGLTSAVKLLRRIGHPRAAELTKEAADYKAAFQKVFREKAHGESEWIDRGGRTHRLVPQDLLVRATGTHIFYIDTGPLFLVYGGLMDASDELMESARRFFREGPNWRTFNPHAHQLQPPVLVHEMSSVEPCYSWNIPHSWQLGDRQRFLEGMYSLFAGGMSHNTYSGNETRGGNSGLSAPFALAFHLARLAVIDDELRENELHLLRLCPLAWVSREKETVFENIVTEFGPVSLRWQLSKDGRTLDVKYEAQFRCKPAKVVVHVPPVEGLNTVRVNAKRHSAKSGSFVALPN